MRPQTLIAGISTPLRPIAHQLPKPQWVCAACRIRSTAKRTLATAPKSMEAKPYYITTPIFYVNAAPHVGHLYTIVLTDILKRWQVLQGNKALLCTGTDEHGMKIQQASAKAGSEPKPFCDKGAEVFKSLAARAQVKYDHFVRTTDPAHKEAVQYAWYLLKERGYIYTSKHEGWYSVSDETFYPESAVHLILDPPTGRKIMASIETGKEVEWTSELNYHFRLSAFKDQLLELYGENPDWIVPQARMSDVVQAVSEGLEDLSISRPVERLTWGITVPDDDSQTIYVWLDALINYITKTGYPWAPGQERALGWPADVQVIGKDIVRFHCIYWPAFLLALDIPPPQRILTHAHWTLGRKKMAKSTGNVVNPFFALDRFGVDTMRFYLAHDGGISQDADYGNEYIIERYKKSLQGGLGNLTSRILRAKNWNVRRAVERFAGKNVSNRSDHHSDQQMLLESLAERTKKHMDELNVSGAIRTIMDAVYQTNKYLQESSPWLLAEVEGYDSEARVDRIVYLCAESIRICGILLQPCMPEKMGRLMDMLGVDIARRSFEYAQMGSDVHYGVSKVDLGVGRGSRGALFPPLASNE
ncbi:methionyl-tRNA synthetase-like protein [Cryomyces antarcticus]|nr:methionyl-tRNA synthetase [Cryomyces antarcticus]